MRWSQFFIPTLRDDPADAEVISHRLLLRAGFIRQLGAGIYSLLPLAQRVSQRVMKIIREEMDSIGGQEFFLPALHPSAVWEESGRWAVMGETMFRLKDRKGADLCLGMTHEEIFTSIARHEIRSYKQLPQVWYQIQTKFRDEERPKSGLMRLRQFIMKDAYSFDVDREGLDKSFEDQRGAYRRIFERCGLKYHIVEASSGSMGGSESNEFMARTPAGEDFIATCEHCGYSANLEKATSKLAPVADEAGPVHVEGVGVLHDELADAHQAGLRPLLVAELGLYLVPDLRELLVRAYLVARDGGEDLLVRHPETHVRALAVAQAEHRLAHHLPAAGLLPDLRGVEGGQEELLAADGVHLLAHDFHRALRDAPAQRQERVDARAELADEARPQQQAVRDDLRVRGVFAERGDEIL